MTIRVMYDLSAFSHSVNSHGYSRLVPSTQTQQRIRAYASVSFFEELASLRKHWPTLYSNILDRYLTATCGRMVLPANELVQREARIGRPLTRDDVVLSRDDYWNAINLLGEEGIDDLVATEVLSKKQNYATKMNDTVKRMMQDPDLREHTRRDVADASRRWFEGAGDLLQDWGESVFGRADIEYKTLPHIRMFIYYFFVKHFQSNVDGKKHQSGDLYDLMYLVESVTLGHFVTDDKDLKRTAELINGTDHRTYDLSGFLHEMGL